LTATIQSAAPGFVGAAAGDYQLARGSVCIDAADGSIAPRPVVQWRPLPGSDPRATHGSAPDIGAFESTQGGTPVQPLSWSGLKARYR
jgi:hypothetical protein